MQKSTLNDRLTVKNHELMEEIKEIKNKNDQLSDKLQGYDKEMQLLSESKNKEIEKLYNAMKQKETDLHVIYFLNLT